MFTFLCPTPLVPQAPPAPPSTAVEQPVSTDFSLSSSPTPGGHISQCLKEFTFTVLPSPPPSNTSPKLLDLFPITSTPSTLTPPPNTTLLWDSNDANKNISDRLKCTVGPSSHCECPTLANQRVPERFQSRWIRKRLTASDANTLSRLLLSKEEIVNKYVLPSINQEQRNACHSFDGLKVKMCDMDTGSEYELILKQWSSGSYVLTSNWRAHFVQRRGLKEGDTIELLWDFKTLRFFFRKLNIISDLS